MGAGAAAVSLLAATVVLRLWNTSLDVPWFYDGDTKSFLQLFHNIQTTGWWTTSDVLGGGSADVSAFPLGGGAIGHFLLIRMLGLAVQDPVSLYNLYLLGSFPVVAIAAYYAFRRLALRPGGAAVFSMLYALLPYHFVRAERGHIFLAAYVAVPLAAMLVVRHATGDAILTRAARGADDRRAAIIEAVVIALLVGSSTVYYALMFVLLLAIVSFVVSVRERSDVVFTSAFRLSAVSGLALAAGLLPTLLTWLSNGGPSGSLVRPYADTEVFSFRLVSGILPTADHRIPLFADLREGIAGSPITGEGPESLGLVGTVGLFLLLWHVAGGLVGGGRPGARAPWAGPLALCLLVALVLATTGGLGAVITAVGFPFLRSWARMGIYVSFFTLAAAGLWLQSRTAARGWPVARTSLLLAGVAVLGILDQTTPAMAPDHDTLRAEYQDDRRYVEELEEHFGPQARVFQVPYMTYPENTEYTRVSWYDHLRWPLAGSTLTWSFGAPRDGSADWQRTVTRLDAGPMVHAVAAVGHDALMVDRLAYGDDAALVAELTAVAGRGLTSPDGRHVTFDLRDVEPPGGEHDLRRLVLGATTVRPGGGFVPTDGTIHQPFRAGSSSVMRVTLGSDIPDDGSYIRLRVRATEEPVRLSITTPDDRLQRTLTEAPTDIDVPIPGGRPETSYDLEFQSEPGNSFQATGTWELLDVGLPLGRALDDVLR